MRHGELFYFNIYFTYLKDVVYYSVNDISSESERDELFNEWGEEECYIVLDKHKASLN